MKTASSCVKKEEESDVPIKEEDSNSVQGGGSRIKQEGEDDIAAKKEEEEDEAPIKEESSESNQEGDVEFKVEPED